jgi:hypothetical protein
MKKECSLIIVYPSHRIRELNWITCKHLDVALNERDQHVRDLVFAAINGKDEA